jgi:NAD(P)-dependent dehydrogenase (short-subunit alcohol dehydrogenase family)
MAKLGLPPICTTIGDFDTQVGILRSWDSATAASGTPTQDVTKPIMINCVVADTDEEATRLAQEYIPRFMQAQLDHYTLRRLGEPAEIGAAALFLASGLASYITGQSIVVDGGQTLPEIKQ